MFNGITDSGCVVKTIEAMAMACGAVRSVRLTQLSLLSNTLHPPQLSHPQSLMVLAKIFWPPLPHIFILLNIKELKLFLVPSLLVQPLLPMLLLTDTDMGTDMDSTTPSLLPPLLPQRRPL